MSRHEQFEPKLFINVKNEELSFRPKVGKKPSAWRKLPGWALIISCHVALFAAFFHLIGFIQIPGVPRLVAVPTSETAVASAAVVPPRIPVSKRATSLPPMAFRVQLRLPPPSPVPAKAAVTTLADDEPTVTPTLTPSEVLTSHGLTKAGLVYVLDEETASLDQIDPLKVQFDAMESNYQQWLANALNESEWHRLDNERIAAAAELGLLDARIAVMPRQGNNLIVAEYQDALATQYQLRTALSARRAELDLGGKQLLPPRRKDMLIQNFQTQRVSFIESSGNLRRSFESLMLKYEGLARNPAVMNALASLKRTTNGLTLGPSPQFTRGYNQLKTAMQAVRPETVPREDQGARKPKNGAKGKRNAQRKPR